MSPVVVLTGFDVFGEGTESKTLSELDRELQEEFPRHYLGAIYYDRSTDDWKKSLAKRLSPLISNPA